MQSVQPLIQPLHFLEKKDLRDSWSMFTSYGYKVGLIEEENELGKLWQNKTATKSQIHHLFSKPILLWFLLSCCLVARVCLTLCNPVDYSTPDFPVLHHLLELAYTHFHPVSDAIPPSHPLSSPSLPAFNLSQHQSLFQWVRRFQHSFLSH